MKKLKEELKYDKKGITLISLVVTIIVLLILAGVTISLLLGDNGIIQQAINSKEQTEISSVREQARLDIADWTADRVTKGENTYINSWEDLKSILGAANPIAENRYYADVTEQGIITPSGYIVNIEDFLNQETIVIDKNPGILEDLGNNKLQISSMEDLIAFSYNVNSGNENYLGKTVVLGRNLDFNDDNSYADSSSKYSIAKNENNITIGYIPDNGSSTSIKDHLTNKDGEGFIPVGGAGYTNSSNTFKGNFDGQFYYLDNYYTNATNYFGGFFGTISTNVTISNFGIESGETKSGSGAPAGGIIGNITNGNINITSCYNRSNISDSANCGGIVGYITGGNQINITNCFNTGNISNATGPSGGIIGLLQSYSQANIINCFNVGNLDSLNSSPLGGIIGFPSTSNDGVCLISNCYNSGNISGNSNGAITGLFYNNTTTINTCYYLSGTASTQDGTNIGNPKSLAEMQTDNFLTQLINGQTDTLWRRQDGINNGLPYLAINY